MVKLKIDGSLVSLNLDRFESLEVLVSHLDDKTRLSKESIKALLKKQKVDASRFSKKSVKKREESQKGTPNVGGNVTKEG